MPPAHTPVRKAAHRLALLGVVGSVVAVVLAAAPFVPIGLDVIAMVGAFSAYGVLLAAGAVVMLGIAAGLRRNRSMIIRLLAAVVVLAVLVAVQAPRWIPDRRPETGPTFVLASVNLHLGDADAESITRATADADVVAFTEITTFTAERLAATAFAERFPYHLDDVTLPHRGAEGTMIYARYPLSPVADLDDDSVHQNWMSTVAVPNLGVVTVVAVHVQRPFLTGTGWLAEHRTITAALPTDPLTVVAGDFNASPDQVLVPGYTSAVDVAGDGWIRTFPVHPWIPRLLRIDHVLLGSGLTTTSVRTLAVDGTDHLGLETVIGRRAP